MRIHDVDLKFELYDADCEEQNARYFEELKKMERITKDVPEGTETERCIYLCERLKGLFDAVFGAGTGCKVCGEGNNLLRCLSAYEQLIAEQIGQQKEYERLLNGIQDMTAEAQVN